MALKTSRLLVTMHWKGMCGTH